MTGSSSWCGRTKRIACYIRGNYSCCYCAKDLRYADPRAIGLDHLEDLIPSGGHTGANHASTNLVMVCRSCNSSRAAASYTEFAAKFPGALERIEAQRRQPLNMKLARSLISGGESADSAA